MVSLSAPIAAVKGTSFRVESDDNGHETHTEEGIVIVTSKSKSIDFVSRFFTPQATILEDPVTGSAHCTLVPYWAKRLKKTTLHARQCSARGGEIWCEDQGERVQVSGLARTFSAGTFSIADSL